MTDSEPRTGSGDVRPEPLLSPRNLLPARRSSRRWGGWLSRLLKTMRQLSDLWQRSQAPSQGGTSPEVAGWNVARRSASAAGCVDPEASAGRSLTALGPEPESDADAVLRRLARRALGYSGADIERLVREARQKARREQRALTYADLDHLLSASRPKISPEKRRRVAVHEAGHVLARILLDLGKLTTVTIDTASGGFTEYSSPDDLVDTAQQCEHYLLATMAGRAAELVVYGSTLSGSGGFAHSDLAKATQLATAMEVSLGFGKRLPLLYRDPDHWQAMIRQDRELARRVHRRLDLAEVAARKLVSRHRSRLEMITDELEARGTLEGRALAVLVERVRAGSSAS